MAQDNIPWPLPAAWKWGTIADVAEVASNLIAPSSVPALPHIAPNHIESGRPRLLPYLTVKEDGVTSPKHRFFPGQILYSKIRPYLRKAVVVDFEGVCSADMYPLNARCDPHYLLWWLLSPGFNNLAMEHQGRTVLPKINQKALYRIPVPIPPATEQRRIASGLNTSFERSGRAREELRRIPRLVARYKQAILAAAFRGDLTADWRRTLEPKNGPLVDEVAALRIAHLKHIGIKEKPAAARSWTPSIELPASWEWVSVDQLATVVQYGSSAKTSNLADVPVLRMGNILDGNLDYHSLKYLPKTHNEFPELLLKGGDILFNRTNSAELVGKTAVYSDTGRPTSFASYLIRIRVIGYLPELMSAYINSGFGRDWVRSVVNQQVGQANVNGTKLRELGVPLLPMDEQKELWSRIKKALAAIDHAATETTRAMELLDRLEQAILATAFRGELVVSDQ
jgi:type I restriction enzyme, S subunit